MSTVAKVGFEIRAQRGLAAHQKGNSVGRGPFGGISLSGNPGATIVSVYSW